MTDKEKFMEEQQVREAIRSLIDRKQLRVNQLHAINAQELQAEKRLKNETIIVSLEHSVNTLIELEHNLRLCGCPDEAYGAS